MTPVTAAYRSKILHFIDDPDKAGDQSFEYYEDGLLLIKNGLILSLGNYLDTRQNIPDGTHVEHYPEHLIIPGFIDTHIHLPQASIIGAHGHQLMDWLNHYAFPAELKFNDPQHAQSESAFFINELLRNGTTTAMVFGSVHSESVDAFFKEALAKNLRMIAGKVLMDRNAPAGLLDTPESGYLQSKTLIEKWHNLGRLQYAVTPRFAPTSSQEQLNKASDLLQEYPSVYLQTHLAENKEEIAWVKSLFPNAKNYLEVYEQAGLLTKRSVFAHGIHLCDKQCQTLAKYSSAISHCPSSNLFLGSGLFNLELPKKHHLNIGLGTDVGAGTSFSLFKTMDQAYKIQQLQGQSLNPMQALYMATLGGAKALDMENKIGSFAIKNEADFIILDLQATDLIKYRISRCLDIKELIFSLCTLGDDRLVSKTFAMGQCVYQRDSH